MWELLNGWHFVLQISVFISMFKQREREVGKYGSLFGSMLFSIFGGKGGCFFVMNKQKPPLCVKQILTEPSASVVEEDTGIWMECSCLM